MAETAAIRPTRDDFNEQLLRLVFRSAPDRLKMVRAGVVAAAGACGFGDDDAVDIALAVDEACANVIMHAYGGRGDADIVLDIYRLRGGIRLRVRDFGPPVAPGAIQPRPLDAVQPGGLGSHFIREIMDDARLERAADGRGNILDLTKRIAGKT
jgi:sigma-B regulation protein RsbU (phosphoserine phosphatase)